MKYLKKFENYDSTGYEGKLFINIPSYVYFKSDIKFQIVFVDSVIFDEKVYNIKGDDVIQFQQYVNGDEAFNYNTRWDQIYAKFEFDKINFMTVEEFYKKYESSYIRILNDILDELDKNIKWTDWKIKKLNRILEKLTIPEVEHIIDARKFNI